jgi:hypothetical protein
MGLCEYLPSVLGHKYVITSGNVQARLLAFVYRRVGALLEGGDENAGSIPVARY